MEHIIPYTIIISTILLSGSSVFLFKKENPKLLKLLLAFSGAFLLSISFLNLIPEIYEREHEKIGIFIIVGFVIQLFLELFTKGIEHGHGHGHECKENHDHSVHLPKIAPLGLMIGLSLHSFLEGMPLVHGFDEHVQHTLTLGIVIHNIPISIVLASIFVRAGYSNKKVLLILLLFSVMTPLGSIVSEFLSSNFISNIQSYFGIIMGIVVGIFLHVSTSILFETSENHQYNIQKFSIVILGFLVAFLIPLH
jgi:zinc transporter ZupT